jgi:hypothetical protein
VAARLVSAAIEDEERRQHARAAAELPYEEP